MAVLVADLQGLWLWGGPGHEVPIFPWKGHVLSFLGLQCPKALCGSWCRILRAVAYFICRAWCQASLLGAPAAKSRQFSSDNSPFWWDLQRCTVLKSLLGGNWSHIPWQCVRFLRPAAPGDPMMSSPWAQSGVLRSVLRQTNVNLKCRNARSQRPQGKPPEKAECITKPGWKREQKMIPRKYLTYREGQIHVPYVFRTRMPKQKYALISFVPGGRAWNITNNRTIHKGPCKGTEGLWGKPVLRASKDPATRTKVSLFAWDPSIYAL